MQWQPIVFVLICIALAVILIFTRWQIQSPLADPRLSSENEKKHDDHKENDHHASEAHGHDDHHGPPKESALDKARNYSIITLMVVIIIAIIVFVGNLMNADYRKHVVNSSGQTQTALNWLNRGGGPTTTTTATPELNVRHSITAPPGTCSAWIPVPAGTQVMACEAHENLQCTSTESDLAKLPFGVRFKDQGGMEHQDRTMYDPDTGNASAVCVYSKTDSDLKMAWWLMPFKAAGS